MIVIVWVHDAYAGALLAVQRQTIKVRVYDRPVIVVPAGMHMLKRR